jgi:hypothetical protein
MTTVECQSTILVVIELLDRLDRLQSAEVTCLSSVSRIVTLIRVLINYYSSTLLRDSPVDVIYKPFHTIQTDIKWYFPDQYLNNRREYIIDTFKNLEIYSDRTQAENVNRCIDIIYELVEYFNVVVPIRTGHYLELKDNTFLRLIVDYVSNYYFAQTEIKIQPYATTFNSKQSCGRQKIEYAIWLEVSRKPGLDDTRNQKKKNGFESL